MTEKSLDMYEQAKKEFEAKKNQVDENEKDKFLKEKKNFPKKKLFFAVTGIIFLIGFYIFNKTEKKEVKEEKNKGGLVNVIGDAPKTRGFVDMPDLPKEKAKDSEKTEITTLPPLPSKVVEKSKPDWFLRKTTRKNESNFSSTNDEATRKENQRNLAQNNSSNRINSSDFDSSGFDSSDTDLSDRLKPTVTDSVSAQILPNMDYLITKGTSIDCTLINAIDTSVEGFVSCRTSSDIYSESGRVLLVEKGSKVIGEYRSLGRNMGDPRLFILWSRLTTPHGVAVELNSAGTDSLGRAGVAGDVDNFWFQRFGSAFLTSIMQDSLQILNSEINRNRSEGVQISTDNTMRQSEKLVEELLAQHRGIMPRLVKNQGEIVRIYVSRDINFNEVYKLRRK